MTMISKTAIGKFFLLVLVWLSCSAVYAEKTPDVDQVIVIKSERKMLLFSSGEVVKEYPIMLGLNPVGHKQKKGDNRTPEGHYVLEGRNPQSRYHRSIHISYPNEADIRRAREKGLDPGRHIAIHGLPVKSEEAEWDFIERDWTNGCIAVTNKAIEEIWDLVPDGTPIEIRP